MGDALEDLTVTLIMTQIITEIDLKYSHGRSPELISNNLSS